jgi:hypothetical protein
MLRQRFARKMSIGVGLLTTICAAVGSEITAGSFLHSAVVITGDSAAHTAHGFFKSNYPATAARTNGALGRTRRTSPETVKAPAVSVGVSRLCRGRALNFVAEPEVNTSSAVPVLAPMSRRGPPASSFA